MRRLGRRGRRARAARPDRARRGSHTDRAGEHLAQAAVYFHFAKFVFVVDPDQMRAAHQRAVACLDDALPHLDPPGRRVEIPFEGDHARRRAPAPARRRTAPGRRAAARAGLHEGGAALDRADLPGPRARDAERRRAGPGRGGVRPADPRRLGAGRRGDLGVPRRPRRRRPLAASACGASASVATTPPRVAAALGDRVTRLRRARRPVQLRRVLGRPSAADPRHLPGPVRSGGRRRGARGRPHAGARRRRRRHRRSAARGLRAAGPADPVAAGREAPRASGARRAADARGRQPRLRERRAVAPPPHRRLARPPRLLDPART